MEKNFDKKDTIIALLTIVVIGLIVFIFRSGSSISPNMQSIGANKDYEFYKHISSYISLLPDEKLEIVDKRIEKVAGSMEQDNSDLAKAIVLVYANEINKDKQTEQILSELKDNIASLVRSSAIDENTIFSKNTECAKLSSNIKGELKGKYSKGSATESEELNFIFYSPTLNTCLYTTNYTYNYSNFAFGKSDYYSKNSYRIYNVSSNNQLGDYPSYYSLEYPYLSKDEQDKSTKKGKRDYAKFVLENSGYNAKLLGSDF